MAVDLNEFVRLSKQVEEMQKDANRIEGAIGQMMQTIKKEFNCKTLEEAEQLKENLTNQLEEIEEEFENELLEFKTRWHDVLEMGDD